MELKSLQIWVKKTIIVNQGKLLMMMIKETLNGKPILEFLNMG
jgi:hypothetical protein